jgi:hypothetical protein
VTADAAICTFSPNLQTLQFPNPNSHPLSPNPLCALTCRNSCTRALSCNGRQRSVIISGLYVLRCCCPCSLFACLDCSCSGCTSQTLDPSVFVLGCSCCCSCPLLQLLLVCAAASAICGFACSCGYHRSLLQQLWPLIALSSAAALAFVLIFISPRLRGQPRLLDLLVAASASCCVLGCSSSGLCLLQQQLFMDAAVSATCYLACSGSCSRSLVQRQCLLPLCCRPPTAIVAASAGIFACCSSSSCSLKQQLLVCAASYVSCRLACCNCSVCSLVSLLLQPIVFFC